MNKVAIILQARMNSTRRPYKIAALYKEKPLLYWQLQRIKKNKYVKDIIVATTDQDLDDVTEFIALQAGAKVFRGDVNDVMLRYINAAEEHDIEYIIRVCGDDPLVDPECIEYLCKEVMDSQYDVITASHNQGWLLGTSAEAFSLHSLKKAYKNSSQEEKEHVVIHFYNNQDTYKIHKIVPKNIFHEISLSVDYQEDVENVLDVLNFFGNIDFSHEELINGLKGNSIKLTHKRIDKYNI
ncbi:NTP transferase domain-containing protein [Sulfurimonas sp. HSL3-2]|uniref:cytidylyltransferase domain-containing protein n=1 Tax=Hydrocurvibacter mobilis TaxID=3131936 RepID=UPI0031F90C62